MNEVNWAEAWSIVGRGLGLVFLIMGLLATVTTVVGKIVQKGEARRKTNKEAGGAK